VDEFCRRRYGFSDGRQNYRLFSPEVHTIRVRVIKPGERKLRDLPTLGKELNSLLKDADEKGLPRGELPAIASEHRKLAGDLGHEVKL
jgi:hypothetical protein